jgi:hypothetical protein
MSNLQKICHRDLNPNNLELKKKIETDLHMTLNYLARRV